MGVLVLSNSADETADYLCARMTECKVPYTRLNTECTTSVCSIVASPKRVALSIDNAAIEPNDVRAVWYRRPEPLNGSQHADQFDGEFAVAEWTAALEGFLAHIPMARWINHPSRIMAASSKIEQLTRAESSGLTVPPWLCTTSPQDALAFLAAQQGRVIAKPLYCGYIERETPENDTVIYTSRVLREHLEGCRESLGAPTLLQREVARGLDMRITVVDDALVAAGLRGAGGEVDVRRNNMTGVRYSIEDVPGHVRKMLLALVRSYELRFAAVDMIQNDDGWHFLEINPNGQWAWLDLLGETKIDAAFLRAFGGKR